MFQKAKQVLWFLIPLVCAISLIIIVACFDQIEEGYQLVAVMPVLYGVMFMLFYNWIFRTDYTITVTLYFGFQFLRLVVMPAAIALAGEKVSSYLGVHSDTVRLATGLMLIEFFAVSLYVIIRAQKKIYKLRTERPTLAGNAIAYILFAMLAVAAYLYFKSRGINLVNFIALAAGEGERQGDSTDTLTSLATAIVTLAISFIFLLIVDHNQRRYSLQKRNQYSNRAIFAAMLVVCIIVGERRSAQIYSAITTCYILMLAFPEKKKRIVLLVAGVAAAVFAFMSIYKMFAVFVHDSYAEALENAEWSVADFASLLQSYFAGPENISLAVEFGEASNLKIEQAFFDFARSTVPISFLMKSHGTVTSVLMNNYIYAGEQDAGHVLSATGYGYIFGGALLCWVPMLLNMAIAFFAEKQFRAAKSYEGIYIWLTVMLRFALNISANTPALVSAATNYLFTSGVALGAAIFVRKVVTRDANPHFVLRDH